MREVRVEAEHLSSCTDYLPFFFFFTIIMRDFLKAGSIFLKKN